MVSNWLLAGKDESPATRVADTADGRDSDENGQQLSGQGELCQQIGL